MQPYSHKRIYSDDGWGEPSRFGRDKRNRRRERRLLHKKARNVGARETARQIEAHERAISQEAEEASQRDWNQWLNDECDRYLDAINGMLR